MKKLFDLANEYVKQSDWKDLALIKLCLCAMGILIGCSVPHRYKKIVITGSVAVFFITYIPLMAKLCKLAADEK